MAMQKFSWMIFPVLFSQQWVLPLRLNYEKARMDIRLRDKGVE